MYSCDINCGGVSVRLFVLVSQIGLLEEVEFIEYSCIKCSVDIHS